MGLKIMRHRTRGEQGFTMVALIAFMTVLSILAAAAVPVLMTQARRETEEELIFRGEEYVRAIQKYQRQFGVYPPDVDSLLESNEMRFLRKEYVDPVTGEPFRLIKANPDGTLEGSRIYDLEDFQGALASAPAGGPAPRDSGAGRDGLSQSGSGLSQGGGAPDRNTGSLNQNGGTFNPNGGGVNQSAFGQGFVGGGTAGAQPGAGQFGTVSASPPAVSALRGFGTPSGGAPAPGNFVLPTAGGLANFGQQAGGPGGFGLPPDGQGNFGQQNGQGFGNIGLQAGGAPQGAGGGDGIRAGRRSDGGGGRRAPSGLAGNMINRSNGGSSGGSGMSQSPFSNSGAGVGAAGQAITGIVGVAANSEARSLKVYNDRDIYAEWEFIALAIAASVPETTGLMPGDENNTGQPNSFQQGGGSPFSSSPNPFQ